MTLLATAIGLTWLVTLYVVYLACTMAYRVAMRWIDSRDRGQVADDLEQAMLDNRAKDTAAFAEFCAAVSESQRITGDRLKALEESASEWTEEARKLRLKRLGGHAQ